MRATAALPLSGVLAAGSAVLWVWPAARCRGNRGRGTACCDPPPPAAHLLAHSSSRHAACCLLCCRAAIIIAATPLGQLVTQPTAAAAWSHAGASAVPGGLVLPPSWELALIKGALGSVWETLEMLSGATLALQALVLATSLFANAPAASSTNSSSGGGVSGAFSGSTASGQLGGLTGMSGMSSSSASAGGAAATANVEVLGGDGETILSGGGGVAGGGADVLPGVRLTYDEPKDADAASAHVLGQLWPQGEWEWRSLAVVSAVRFVAMPLLGWGLVLLLWRLGALPRDPVVVLALLLQGAMPPAQNIVLMQQLQPQTAALAPVAARLMLQLYTIAVVPVTFWLALFAAQAAVIM